jgi:WD40 repeat protein
MSDDGVAESARERRRQRRQEGNAADPAPAEPEAELSVASSARARSRRERAAEEPAPSSAEDGDAAAESSAGGRAARRGRRRGGADDATEEEAAPAAGDAQPKSRRELRRAAIEEAAPAAASTASESEDEGSAAGAKPKRHFIFKRLAQKSPKQPAQKSPPSSPRKERLTIKERLAAARGGGGADTQKEKAAGSTERERVPFRGDDDDSDSERSDRSSKPASMVSRSSKPASRQSSLPASRQGSLPGSPSKRQASIVALQRAASSVVAMARQRRGAEMADRLGLSEFDRATLFDSPEQLERIAGMLTSLTIHRTDELPHDARIRHPVLCMHVINSRTGHHLRKSLPGRPGATAHETQDFLLPMMSKPFKLAGAAMRLPAWEEELLLAEELTYLLHPQVYIFFELLDFQTPADLGGGGLDRGKHPTGWQPIAWAFLKILSGPERANEGGKRRPNLPTEPAATTRPLQLQLYKWQRRVRTPERTQPPVWGQFVAAGRRAYSSALHVTLRAVPPPEPVAVRFPYRPMAAHHVEEGRLSHEQLVASTTKARGLEGGLGGAGGGAAGGAAGGGAGGASGGGGGGGSGNLKIVPRHGGPCLMPNALLHALPAGANGATALALSPDGTLLAAALADGERALLALYDVASGRQRMLLHAHHRTVHELSWSADGSRLVSVSADGSAKVWHPSALLDETNPEPQVEPLAVLPHPAFVYCGRLLGSTAKAAGAARGGATAAATAAAAAASPSLLATGANDCAVRLWDVAEAATLGGPGFKPPVPLCTKLEHAARVNALVWSADGAHLFSADGAGVIKRWELLGTQGTRGAELRCLHTIEKAELLGAPINSLTLHPTRQRLLIGTRRHQLISLDLRLLHVSMRYTGHTCGKYHLRAVHSPDGRFVVAGSEDGSLFAWSEESGALLIDGRQLGLSGPLLQLAWCQHDHVLAVCGFGPNSPLLVYHYDPEQPGLAALPAAGLAVNPAPPPEERAGAPATAPAAIRAGSPPPARAPGSRAAGKVTGAGLLVDADAASRRNARRRGGNVPAAA